MFWSVLSIVRLLFEGGYYSRAASIQGRCLFEGGDYCLFKEALCICEKQLSSLHH